MHRALHKSLLRLLLLAGFGYLGLCGLVFATQRSLIYLPQPRTLPAGPALMSLQAGDVRLQLSVRGRTHAPALIYFGGNAEDVSLSVDALAAAFPQHALYLLHYRGYGGSEGAPTEAALFADALAVHAHVAARHPRVSVIGRSLGSGVAVYLASRREVESLLLVTPFDSIAALASRQFPFLPVRWLLLDRYDSAAYAPAVRAPTRILVAERDQVIPPVHSQRLLQAFAPGVAELRVLAGVGHNSIAGHPDYLRQLTLPIERQGRAPAE
jgi:hypothetical protein